MEQRISPALRRYNYVEGRIEEQYHMLSTSLGLSDSAFNILYALYEEGSGISQKTIYKMSGMSRKTAGSSLKLLQEQGYLTLQKGDSGRGNLVFLTEMGERFLEEKIAPVIQAENRIFASWTPEERESFLGLTDRYLTQITKEFRTLRVT